MLLKNQEKRNIRLLALGVFTILLILIFNDYRKWDLIIICRFPIFLIGFIVGFWMQEKRRLTKLEFSSLIMIMIGAVIFFVLDEKMSIPLVGWRWLIFGAIVPVLCLLLSNILQYLNSDSWGMKVLQWIGNNSLEIYLLNIIIVRFSKIFIPKSFKGNNIPYIIFVIFTIVFNILFIYLKEKCVMRIKLNKKA